MFSLVLKHSVAGESVNKKINRLIKIMNKKKIDYIFISSGENICWLLKYKRKRSSKFSSC